MAILGLGTTVTYEDSSGTAQTIGKITSIGGLDGEANDIETTNFASSGEEMQPGIPRFGQVTIGVDRDLDDAGQVAVLDALEDGDTREMVITLPSGTNNTITLNAYVKSFPLGDAAVDDVYRTTITFKITGVPVISAV